MTVVVHPISADFFVALHQILDELAPHVAAVRSAQQEFGACVAVLNNMYNECAGPDPEHDTITVDSAREFLRTGSGRLSSLRPSNQDDGSSSNTAARHYDTRSRGTR